MFRICSRHARSLVRRRTQVRNFTSKTETSRQETASSSQWLYTTAGLFTGLALVAGVSLSKEDVKIFNDDASVGSAPVHDVIISYSELQKHNSVHDCWVAIHGKVYDLTDFLEKHPGGAQRILKYAGGDATKGFSSMHMPEIIARQLGPNACIGEVHDLPTTSKKKTKKEKEKTKNHRPERKSRSSKKKSVVWDEDDEQDLFERRRQKFIANKPPLTQMFNLTDFESVAQKVLDPVRYNYFATGSYDEFTLRENHYAYGRVFFRPRIGVDMTKSHITSTMLGYPTAAPIYISSFAGSHLCHPDAELNLIRAAGNENIPYLIPVHSSKSLEEIVQNAVSPEQTLFFQLDFYTQDQIDKAQDLFKKIETTMPNIKAVFINVDIAAAGKRERDNKIRSQSEGDTINELNALISDDTEYAPMTWDNFKKFQTQTKLPLLIKGAQSSEDILIAAKLGLKGAIISNHGGRQLDYSRPPLEILAESKKLLVKNGITEGFELYLDGGVRRGSDVMKAVALGATAVGIGRPFLYAMSGYGEEGVTQVIKMLKSEMKRDMLLLGAPTFKDLNESFVDTESLAIKGIRTSDQQYNANYMEMPTVPLKH